MTLSSADLATLDSLAARGTVQGSDLIPILPAGGTTLQKTTAAALGANAGGSLPNVGSFGFVDPTGAADSLPGFAAAVASGQSFFIPAGLYKLSATLNLTAAANHGQRIVGAGPVADDGGGTGKTVLQPTSAVSTAVYIDGSGFGGYVQGAGLENLTIDMGAMADSTLVRAVWQGQGYDCGYKNVRTINYGINNLSWRFTTGAFTTQLTNCQGGAVRFNGTALDNAVTTITLTNCDLLSVGGDYHVNVTLMGGAVQQPYTSSLPVTYLAPGTSPYAYLPNTEGIYVAALTALENCIGFTSIGTDWEQGGGFPSTYNDGTHGTLPLIRVLVASSTCQNASFITPRFAGMYLLDEGVSTLILGQDIGAGGGDIATRPAYHLGSLNVAGQIVGFTDLSQLLNTDATTTFTINAADGSANFLKLNVQPAADGDERFCIRNAATSPLLDFSTAGGSGILALNYGGQISGYTDAFTTQTWAITATNGIANFRGLNIQPGVDGNSVVLIKEAGGTALMGFNTSASVSGSSIYCYQGLTLSGFSDGGSTLKWSANFSTGQTIVGSLQVGSTAPVAGAITSSGPIRTVGTTFASLPAPATVGNGARAFITDSPTAASGNFATAVTTGGGSNGVPLYSDGGSWRIG